MTVEMEIVLSFIDQVLDYEKLSITTIVVLLVPILVFCISNYFKLG